MHRRKAKVLTVTSPSEATDTRQLVIVGSSAGGVEALSTLVSTLPDDLPAPVVIAQHLDPNRPSSLDRILASRSSATVEAIDRTTRLVPGTIYVVSPDRHVTIHDGEIEVHPDGDDRPKPSINLLLASAADVYGERLTAVILTGSGSDGATGAMVVKEAGGTVIIQDPETAAFPSMPRSLPPSIVDWVAPIERLGDILVSLVTASDRLGLDSDPSLPTLLAELRSRRGINFAAYKTPTLIRRLERRMMAVGAPSVSDYLRFLRTNPDEERRLVSSFLIKVTRFFRDASLFDHLRDTVLPELVTVAVAEKRELRIWSAGCATGEEAYSLAILLAQLTASDPSPPGVRIFATDLDEDAVAFARRGIYSSGSVLDMPKELVDRYFTAHDGAYEVRKSIRSMVIFGSHDLGQRPPFPHVDLILCRNVLIYFTPGLQQQTLESFAYSIRDGGYLVLGTSETPRPLADQFHVQDRRHRVYRRQGPRPNLRLSWPSSITTAAPVPTSLSPDTPGLAPAARQTLNGLASDGEGRNQRTVFAGTRSEAILRQLDIGIVVVDRLYDIGFINGVARQLLGIHGVALGSDFIHLADRIPSPALRAAIDAAFRGEGATRLDRLRVVEPATGDVSHLSIRCQPEQREGNGPVTGVLITIEDVTDAQRLETAAADAGEGLRAGQTELRTTVEQLIRANRQLLVANRELSDTADDLREQGEELRIVNSAAQVSTEEIETLNEELQATNEELETLNEETQATVEELNATNDELIARSAELEELAETNAVERARLSAILGSMGEAVLVVDASGAAVQSNRAYDDLIVGLGGRLVIRDEQGVPLPRERTPQWRAANGEDFTVEFRVADGPVGDRWFEATGSPMQGDARTGGVLVIRETTDRRLRRLEEQFLHIAGHELRSPLTALLGYLQLVKRRTDQLGDDRLARQVDRAVEQAQRQASLITQLMEVGRLRSGKLNLTVEPLDIVALTRGTVETMGVVAPDRTITLAADTETLMVRGDALRLEQVLNNLLTNAVRYAPGEEPIEVRIHRVAAEAVVEVEDHGPGISASDLEDIFDLLRQVERPDRADRGQPGLGLGLYISREIMEAHDGSLTVHSRVGDGSTFVIRLPLGPA